MTGQGGGGSDRKEEEDLWFLPGPLEEDNLPPGAPPLPRTAQKNLFDPAEWRAAQNSVSGELAHLAQAFGELDVRLRDAPPGLHLRLALREASDLSWWSGDRLSLDRLSLWHLLRIGSTENTEQAYARAGWAIRRLSTSGALEEDLTGFLGRASEGEEISEFGAEVGAVQAMAELMTTLTDLHPVTQSAILFNAWKILGAPWSRDLEAAVLAAKHASSISRKPGQGARFLPLALSGAETFRGQGSVEQKLRYWVCGAERATLAALLHLEVVSEWQRKAQASVTDLSGRTPMQLITTFAAYPLVSAPMATRETGASRAAVQRNLDILAARGLIREITGQGRFRIWSIA